jgi:hypothetical protein
MQFQHLISGFELWESEQRKAKSKTKKTSKTKSHIAMHCMHYEIVHTCMVIAQA